MAQRELIPEIPFETRAARIGSCYNVLTRSLLPSKIAIDPDKLDAKAIQMVNGSGKLSLRANASAAQDADETFFAANAGKKIGSWATIGFDMDFSASEANTSSNLNCYCSYVFTGQRLVLMDHGPLTLFNYMTDEFQAAFTALLATPPSQFFGKYLSFIQTFGSGCVTELRLCSGSAFEITASYADTASTSKSKYGGSIAIGSALGGSSVAAEYAKMVQTASSEASMQIDAAQLPESTPTLDWCNSLMQSIADAGFAMLSQQPSLVQPYSGTGPEAPEIPEGTPSQKELPLEEVPDISAELQEQIMAEDKFEGTWEDYQRAQEEAFRRLQPHEVVREVNQNMGQLLPYVQHGDGAQPTVAPPAQELSAEAMAWDLGGYVPYGYTITPWEQLFPQLKSIGVPSTFSGIYIAKAFIYYQTKMEFSSYLYLLKDVGTRLCKNPLIAQDADNYSKQCAELLQKIKKQIECSKNFRESDCQKIIAEFETEIQEMKHFNSKVVYSEFFHHYDFFTENACGFLRVAIDQNNVMRYASVEKDTFSFEAPPKPFSVIPMLKDGMRIYPVIQMDGSVQSVAFLDLEWHEVINMKEGLRTQKVKDENGFYYYPAERSTEIISGKICSMENRLYGAGFDELDALNGDPIRGLPMIHPFDFDAILSFAKPNDEA